MSVYKQYLKENEGRVFDIYGYSPPPQGEWWIDDETYYTDDFRTEERYREYLDCGFNVLFMQSTAAYNGEDWATSETKKTMETAVRAGVKKIIIVDNRIMELSREEDSLIGEGKKFATEKALDDFIRDCINTYKNQEGFYGVQLADEPFHPRLKVVGQLFKSIRRVYPEVFVHCNLNPMQGTGLAYRICPAGKNLVDSYEKYLSTFMEESDSDYIMMDTYPFYKSPDKAHIGRYHFAGLECVARVCKKYGKEMHIVMQSFGMNIRTKTYHVLPNEQKMQYQKNALICFGVKEFAYFTYWTKQMNRRSGEMFPDGKAMLTRNGEKTKVWYYVQKVNRELTKLAPILLNFEYCSNAFFVKPIFCTSPTFLETVRGGELSQVTSVDTDREVVLVSELYDKAKDQYMICAMNPTDPERYRKKYKKEKQRTTLTFDEKYTTVDVYQKGRWKTLPLEDGKLVVELNSGDGAIVLPYKEV